MSQATDAASPLKDDAAASDKSGKTMNQSNRKHGLVPELLRLMSRFMTCEKLEVEVKLGIIQDKRTRKRITIWADSDKLITKQKYHETMNFISGVSKDHFDMLEADINTQTCNGEKESNELSQTVLNVDKCFKDNFRITQRDGKETLVKKSRIQDFVIYRPNSIYDLKISLSTEVEHPIESIRGDPILIRRKQRRSYRSPSYQYDFTIIEASVDTPQGYNSYEFEMEVSDIERFRSTVSSQQSEDGISTIESFLRAIPNVPNTQQNSSSGGLAGQSSEEKRRNGAETSLLRKPSSPNRFKRKIEDTAS